MFTQNVTVTCHYLSLGEVLVFSAFLSSEVDFLVLYLLQENKTWHKILKHFIKTLNIMK